MGWNSIPSQREERVAIAPVALCYRAHDRRWLRRPWRRSTLRYSCVPRGWFNGIEVPFSFRFNTSFLFPNRIKREENSLSPLPSSLSQNMAQPKSWNLCAKIRLYCRLKWGTFCDDLYPLLLKPKGLFPQTMNPLEPRGGLRLPLIKSKGIRCCHCPVSSPTPWDLMTSLTYSVLKKSSQNQRTGVRSPPRFRDAARGSGKRWKEIRLFSHFPPPSSLLTDRCK